MKAKSRASPVKKKVLPYFLTSFCHCSLPPRHTNQVSPQMSFARRIPPGCLDVESSLAMYGHVGWIIRLSTCKFPGAKTTFIFGTIPFFSVLNGVPGTKHIFNPYLLSE